MNGERLVGAGAEFGRNSGISDRINNGVMQYGVRLFESVVTTVRSAGFDSYRTAMWAHLLIEYVVSMAFAAVRHRFPGEHGEHLDGIFAALDPKDFPSIDFVRKDYVRLNAGEAFSEALRLMLTTIELERPKRR